MTQQARNISMELADPTNTVKFLILDRDTKFTASLDAVFAAEGTNVIKTPIRAPQANAICEWVVGTIRRECLDRNSSSAAVISRPYLPTTSTITTRTGPTDPSASTGAEYHPAAGGEWSRLVEWSRLSEPPGPEPPPGRSHRRAGAACRRRSAAISLGTWTESPGPVISYRNERLTSPLVELVIRGVPVHGVVSEQGARCRAISPPVLPGCSPETPSSARATAEAAPGTGSRVVVDGKFFATSEGRLRLSGVTYGTFRPRSDGARFPEAPMVRSDMAAIGLAGANLIRTYTAPPDDVVEHAAGNGLRLLAGLFYPDWRYLLGGGRREMRRVAKDAEATVRAEARRLACNPSVLGVCLGNEIPADVLRWYGSGRIASVIERLAECVKDIDDGLLTTYANYPTAEYLPLGGVDFVTFNVFLEREHDFQRHLTRLQNLAGDRPLLLGELGLDSGGTPEGEQRQAETLDWQLEVALERGVAGACVFSWTDEWHVGESDVEGWHFGLTTRDRQPRPALKMFSRWADRQVRDLLDEWPSLAVVICAYNASATLDECLTHTCALDYPGLEIIVVDDGSTDSTPDIAKRHPRARLVHIPHAGLSAARNAGWQAASSAIVAYLDSDAFPSPEWPYYLALAFDGPDVAAAGGPNIPPLSDGLGAQMVARGPGGPVHVLLTDDRAEHVPGCNMAFYSFTLARIGGFDPTYTAAGDDVDACWKVLDQGSEIGFHPAALVWHHRRPGIRTYLRQQKGYGRAESLVRQRHPDRFNGIGTARWHGRIYNSLVPSLARARIYRGLYGGAAYQSIYGGESYALDIAHQLGVPVCAIALLSTPLAIWLPALALIPAAAVAALIVLSVIDALRVRPPSALHGAALRFRAGVVACHLLQPVVRTYSRLHQRLVLGHPEPRVEVPPAAGRTEGVVLYEATSGRPAMISHLIEALRGMGARLELPTGWEDYDARLSLSVFLCGDLLSSAYPEGWVQVRLRRHLRWGRLIAATLLCVLLLFFVPVAAAPIGAWLAVDISAGWLLTRRWVSKLAGGRRAPSGRG